MCVFCARPVKRLNFAGLVSILGRVCVIVCVVICDRSAVLIVCRFLCCTVCGMCGSVFAQFACSSVSVLRMIR